MYCRRKKKKHRPQQYQLHDRNADDVEMGGGKAESNRIGKVHSSSGSTQQ